MGDAESDLNEHYSGSKDVHAKIKSAIEQYTQQKEDDLRQLIADAKKIINPYGDEDKAADHIKATFNQITLEFDSVVPDFV